MKSRLIFLALFVPVSAFAAETKLARFLKTCAWGTAIGAGVGAVSLVFEDKPSEHTVNIARGASLGLYGGIAYGLVETEKETRMQQRPEVDDYIGGVRPVIDKGRVAGAEATLLFRL